MQPASVQSFPASFAQQRLWLLEQYEPETGAYNIPAAWRLNGHLDIVALEGSLQDLVQRHEVLRTTFAVEEGSVVQRVAEDLHIALDVQERIGGQEDAVWLRAQAQAPFDLEHGPLVRVVLLRCAPREHVLALTVHHIVSDGWSMGVLMQELGELYAARREDRAPRLPPLTIQYADYTAWQRQWLQGDVLRRQLEYWRQTLEGAPAMLALPTDRPRPAVLGHRGGSVAFELPVDLTSRLRNLGTAYGTSLFTTLAATFSLLLNRYSGQADVCIGYPTASRSRPELESLIGFFVNTLVLRVQVDARQSFLNLQQQVRDRVLDAESHKDLPFEKLVEELRPQRSLNHAPLFQAMFAFYDDGSTEGTNLQLPDVAVQRLAHQSETAKFDLTLDITARSGQLLGELEYHVDLFDRSTIERMVGHFKTLLQAIVANPNSRVQDLPLLTEQEQAQLLAWNETSRQTERVCVHELFEQQAAATPNATAVVCGSDSVTYGELNASANMLAHHLRSLGVGPDQMVGLCLERGVAMVRAMLAILKAGGAYLPLDPEYPAHRLDFMLQDCASPVLVTHHAQCDRLPPHAAHTVLLDDHAQAISLHPDHNLEPVASPDHLAWCIYTSGSTGQPKGVLLEHASAASFLAWAASQFGVADLSMTIASTSICFDLSVFEIFAPLSVGTTVILVKDALEVAELPLGITATLFNTVPSAVDALLLAGRMPASLRVVNLAGEPLSRSLANRLHSALPNVRLWNLYGPTEFTTYATGCIVERSPDARVTIGQPLSNTAVRVLDATLRPVPTGVIGEVFIAGCGLARGYHRRPELTAEHFVPDAQGAPGSRMYRTGDLARILADGSLDFIGRRDHQVKSRGFRIELGEIETHVGSHPAVRECVATTWKDDGGVDYVVAYVVMHPGVLANINDIQDHAARLLPKHAVPSRWAVLPALPRTPNGKVDRAALSATELTAPPPSGSEDFATDTERAVAEIMTSLLGLEVSDRKADFFHMGGHSLMAVAFVTAISRRWKLNFPLRALFQHPVVEDLARQVDAMMSAGDRQNKAVHRATEPRLVLMKAASPPACHLVLVHPIAGGVASYLDVVERVASGPFASILAVHGVEPATDTSAIDRAAMMPSIGSVYAERLLHEELTGPVVLGGWSSGANVAYEMACALEAAGRRPTALILIDPTSPDIDDDVPFRTDHPSPDEIWRRYERIVLGSEWVQELHQNAAYLQADIRQRMDMLLQMRHRMKGVPTNRTYINSSPEKRLAILKQLRESMRGLPYLSGSDDESWAEFKFIELMLTCDLTTGPQTLGGVPTTLVASSESGWKLQHEKHWRRFCLGGLTVREVEGSHVGVMLEKFAAAGTAEVVREVLSSVIHGHGGHH